MPGPAADGDRLSALLETQLTPYGFEAERVSDRLANFLAVQNTYLSTFQTLGGLGLLLGTLGLATVMVRNVLERRGELALFSALGFRRRRAWPGSCWWRRACFWSVDLLTGTVAALVAMVPHLSSIGADVPWGSLALILAIVFRRRHAGGACRVDPGGPHADPRRTSLRIDAARIDRQLK